MFRPSVRSLNLLCPRLTSANSSRHLSMPVVRDKLTDLPGYCALTFTLMPAASTHKLSVQVSDFEDICPLIQLARLVCDFCSSSQRFACGFLQIPPRDGHPCRPANDSPCRVRRRLSLPSKSALPGAPMRKPRAANNAGPFFKPFENAAVERLAELFSGLFYVAASRLNSPRFCHGY